MEARERGKKNEYESAKGWSPSQRENEGNVCERDRESQHTGRRRK